MESQDSVEEAGVFATSLSLERWIRCAHEQLAKFHQRNVTVVSLIGKDFPNRSKAEDLNDFLRMKVFSTETNVFAKIGIDVFYAADEDVVFLVVNNPADTANLLQTFKSGNSAENFFGKMRDSEHEYLNMLHFVSLVSHMIIFSEPYPRFDMALVRYLKSVNKIRLSGRSEISSTLESLDSEEFSSDSRLVKDGRLAMPRLSFIFQKSLIRTELGVAKKKEIVQKLEMSLEDQIYNVMKQCRLVENGTGPSFGYIPYQRDRFVRLMTPSAATRNPMGELVDFILGKTEEHDEEKDESASEGFSRYLRGQLSSVRQDKHRSLPLPTLGALLDIFESIHSAIWNEDAITNLTTTAVSKEIRLMDDLTRLAINEAVEQYSWQSGKEKDRAVFTKAEHIQRFGAAVSYLDSVLVGPREQAMAKLRKKCESLWQGGMQCCEQQSVTGNNCTKPVHPCIGDQSVSEKQWELHDSSVTFISTCSCGRMQEIRRDPFSVKEANYDFFFANPTFSCCKGLERHGFAVVEDEEAELDEGWNGDEEWPQPAVQSLQNTTVRGTRSSKRTKERTESIDESEEEASSSQSQVSSDSESAEVDNFRSGRAYTQKGAFKDPSDHRLTAIADFVKKQKRVDARKTAYLLGIPNSVSPAVPPIFPSWSLTCIGSSSIYSHALGLRDQPNFKIANEYLLPVDIQLQVDPDSWEQDMDFVNAVEGAGFTRYRKPKRVGYEMERVKLFVGFDYECPRGHRFFVDSCGEPLVLPKGHSARDAACREAGFGLLEADLPLRRQCTCRKQPNQPAQLMKVHIVTPKAPVTVTIEPKVFVPNHEGFYHTGEGPLRLGWAKYYILQMPFVYSGPSGLWIPPKNLERHGTFKGNAIRVVYTPLEKN